MYIKRGSHMSVVNTVKWEHRSTILTNKIMDLLKDTYHNINYYNSRGLATRNFLFWWPLADRGSRLKALDILKQAIIND